MPLLIQDAAVYMGAIAGLEGLAGSIRCFDAPLADRLKQVIDRLRIQLNVLLIIRADLEASIMQTAAKLKVTGILELEDLER